MSLLPSGAVNYAVDWANLWFFTGCGGMGSGDRTRQSPNSLHLTPIQRNQIEEVVSSSSFLIVTKWVTRAQLFIVIYRPVGS